MNSKLNRFALIVALSIAGAAAAAPVAAEKKAELASLEAGNPHSVNYGNRSVSPGTNEQILSVETGSPDAVW